MTYSITSKKLGLLSLSTLLFFSFTAQARLIVLDSTAVFPPTTELQTSSQTVRLYNHLGYPIEVIGIDRFETYGNKVFSVSDSIFTVQPGDTFNLSISFSPEHNIFYKQTIVFRSSSGFGHTSVDVEGQGVFSKAYYSSTQNKHQEALKTALSTRLAQGYNDLGYTGARDQMYASIDNVNGQVECVYTGRTATFNTRAGANTNSFNCEHTFPQGFFNSNVPMRSDIHHLFPTDVTANSRRGNDPFGVVSSASWSQGGSKSGGGKFEPRDAHKGAVARAMMYFVIRYQDYSNHFSGQENILRQWHDLYPPSTNERNRNADIFALQNNRNPFVDYPQFIERISDIDGNASSSQVSDLYISDDTIFLAQGNNQRTWYGLVLYNQGNQSLTLQNFMTNVPALSLDLFTPSITLEPGESYRLAVVFFTAQPYNATLSFEVSNGIGIQTIPVLSGQQLGSRESEAEALPNFYPNPSHGTVAIDHPELIAQLFLIDASGKEQQFKPSNLMDLSDLPKGLYTWRIVLKERGIINYQKFILN